MSSTAPCASTKIPPKHTNLVYVHQIFLLHTIELSPVVLTG